jgi:hypothetical protein
VIIKGNAVMGRASSIGELARHLLRADTNEMVNVLEVRGTVATDLRGAMREMSALGLCVTSARPLYHANIDPSPDEAPLTDQQKVYAIERLEDELGFSERPRIVVEHVKDGRPHLHAVWSRIDVERGRVISNSYNYRRHEVVARELEQTFGHRRIQGAHVGRGDLPRPDRCPSDVERRQAERSGLSPEQATDLVTGLWHTTDSGRAFVTAIEAQGWVCARGDRRDFVLIDPTGETHSLARRVRGAKARDARERMADVDPADLPSVQESRAIVRARASQDEEPAIPPARADLRQTAGGAANDAIGERNDVQASGLSLIEEGRRTQEIAAFNAEIIAHQAAVARYRASIKRAERRHGKGRDTETPGTAAISTRQRAGSINQSGGAIESTLRQTGPSFRERRAASDRRLAAARATVGLMNLQSTPQSDAIALAAAELERQDKAAREILLARLRLATGGESALELRYEISCIGQDAVTPVLIRLDRIGLKIPAERTDKQRIYRIPAESTVMALGRASPEDREDLLRLLPNAVLASRALREAESSSATAAIRAQLAAEASPMPHVPGILMQTPNPSRSPGESPIHIKPGSPAAAPPVTPGSQGRAGTPGFFPLARALLTPVIRATGIVVQPANPTRLPDTGPVHIPPGSPGAAPPVTTHGQERAETPGDVRQSVIPDPEIAGAAQPARRGASLATAASPTHLAATETPIADRHSRPGDKSDRPSDFPKYADPILVAHALKAGAASRSQPAASPAAPEPVIVGKAETPARQPDGRHEAAQPVAAPVGTEAARAMLRKPRMISEKEGYVWFFMASLKKFDLPAAAPEGPGLGAALKDLGITPDIMRKKNGGFRVRISLEDLAAALGRLMQADLDRWEKRLREATNDAGKAYADYQRRLRELGEGKHPKGGMEL